MESIIKIGEKEVKVNNRAGWTITYRDQFGHDIVPTLMPLFAGALDVISGLIKETGKTDNIEITDILAMTDGDALINAFIHLSGFEFVEFLNITWAMAKEADDSIPEPKTWVRSLCSSKNLERLRAISDSMAKKPQPKKKKKTT